MEALTQPVVEIGVAAFTKPGETETGDRYLVSFLPVGAVVVVVDGVGHGHDAALAGEKAIAIAAEHLTEGATSVFTHCQAGLTSLRGVVMSMATFHAANDTMSWLGVGNVEAVLLRHDPKAVPQREVLVLRGGIVGGRLPLLREASVALSPGDTLVLATDGVRGSFLFDLRPNAPPATLAQSILDAHCLGSDDALVVVVRYLGRLI